MNATLTVEEYRRAIATGEMPKPGTMIKVDSIRHGVAYFEGGKKVFEVNSPWQTVKKPRQHIEDDITEMVADYLNILLAQGKIREYTHTANETYTKSMRQKARNVRMGVRSGIPDMIIVTKRAVLFLELKRPNGGVMSPTQKVWCEALGAVGGPVHCGVAYGYDAAKVLIDSVL